MFDAILVYNETACYFFLLGWDRCKISLRHKLFYYIASLPIFFWYLERFVVSDNKIAESQSDHLYNHVDVFLLRMPTKKFHYEKI